MQNIFIINPKAGKRNATQYVPIIQSKVPHSIIKITKYPKHATEIAREYSSQSPCRIFSLGGDGTLNEVVNGMMNTESVLGVIPCGSGNDFIRYYTQNFTDIFDRTLKGTIVPIDVMKVNDFYSINISSIGFDAEIALHAQKFKNLPFISSRAAYFISIIYSLLNLHFYEATINIDGVIFNNKWILSAFANGKYYGGGIKPVPTAINDDGFIDVCMVRETNKLFVLKVLPRYIKGTHQNLEVATFRQGKKIIIQSKKALPLNIDGEISTSSQISIEILPRKLNILKPLDI